MNWQLFDLDCPHNPSLYGVLLAYWWQVATDAEPHAPVITFGLN